MNRAIQVARQAAQQAGEIMLRGLTGSYNIDYKGRYDLVTDIDRQSEECILNILHKAYPQATLVAEESVDGAISLQGQEVWLVDPLDGTTNYAHRYPVFSCTLAYLQDGICQAGVVYDPLRQECFEALAGAGAFLNGQKIQVSQIQSLSQSILATGFPYSRLEQEQTNLDRFCELTMRTQGVRRSGSAALDLAHTACGRLDGFWEIMLKPWDMVAGALLVQEAGGQISNCQGDEFDPASGEICSSNSLIHRELLHALQIKTRIYG